MTRLTPNIPFPPYSYVTGRFPHPTRDPAGHSYGHSAARPLPLDPGNWNTSQPYLYAIDLFNHGYYWEAHEAWEALWHAAGRRGPMADFLKGLIKLAAGGVKVLEGRPEGVRRHARRAIELFHSVGNDSTCAAGSSFCGLNLGELVHFAEQIAANPPVAQDRAAPVEVVFSFELCPGEPGNFSHG
jgi:hypothetical protein